MTETIITCDCCGFEDTWDAAKEDMSDFNKRFTQHQQNKAGVIAAERERIIRLIGKRIPGEWWKELRKDLSDLIRGVSK